MTGLVVFTVIDVVLLIAGLAFYLFWVGSLLTKIAGNLEECAGTVREIVGHAKLIGPAGLGDAPLAPARRGGLPAGTVGPAGQCWGM